MKSKILIFYSCKGMFWFRIFGRGLHFKNTKYHELLFSERNNLAVLKIGNYYIRYLKKWYP